VATTNPFLQLAVLRADLERVEAELAAAVRAEDPFLTELASHLIRAGGKRVRPTLTLVAAGTRSATLTPASQAAVLGAVSVELVHLGSLYHDDVMDDATTRRTVESVNARWGNLRAILAGDYLLAKASEIAASLGTEVAGLLAATIGRLCEGQVLELEWAFDLRRSEESYFTSIAGKTASLLSTACRVGALVADLPRSQVDALSAFGHAYGMAFQIIDDVLDLVATEVELGKPAGHDLVEGVYTLPVIRALAGDAGPALRAHLGAPLDRAALDEAIAVVRDSGAVEASLATARSYADDARRAIEPFATTEAGAALVAATEALLASVTSVAPR